MSDYNNDDIKNTEDEQKYEDVCYMCRRPESKTGRMLHIPGMNNMCICIDCMGNIRDVIPFPRTVNNCEL